MKILSLLSLLAVAGASATVRAAEPAPAPAPAAECITLSADQQVVRANASQDVLLRNADQHYIVHFRNSCTSAATSAKLDFATAGRDGELCSGGVSSLNTQKQTCVISKVEPITPQQFATRARGRR